MQEPKNGFTAKPFIFNGASGYILRQYVNGVLYVEQFINNLPEWCKVARVSLYSIIIIE